MKKANRDFLEKIEQTAKTRKQDIINSNDTLEFKGKIYYI